MTRKVTISYSSPGLQPPVYITTSLSEPQWDLLEMGCSESPSGEWEFSKTFSAVEGEYQYKFRLGPGDWWVCDENKPTVDDGFGDRNNVLVVKNEAPVKKHAAEPHDLVDEDDEVFESPTLPHERNSSKAHIKRDSLGDDVLRDYSVNDAKTADKHYGGEQREEHAPLLSHEQSGSPHSKLQVPSETVPVNFSRQDTLALGVDEENVDVGSSEFPEAPKFQHERDISPARTPTPGLDEGFNDDDDMDQPPLMRHETLSSDSGKSSHETTGAEKHVDTPGSPTSSHSSAHWVDTQSHIPAEADPNDPSLFKLDILCSASPTTQSLSQSSQSPSLPSVLEDDEEEEDSTEHTQPHAPSSGLQNLPSGLRTLAGTNGRPAALITPPRTPDESKAPLSPQSVTGGHHHKPAAEKDMREEAKHDVKHHESHHHKHHPKSAAAKPADLDGDSEPSDSIKPESQAKSEETKASKEPSEKSTRSGMFETVLGLGLFVAVGVGAAWLAFMMQDPIKDGGAVLTGTS